MSVTECRSISNGCFVENVRLFLLRFEWSLRQLHGYGRINRRQRRPSQTWTRILFRVSLDYFTATWRHDQRGNENSTRKREREREIKVTTVRLLSDLKSLIGLSEKGQQSFVFFWYVFFFSFFPLVGQLEIDSLDDLLLHKKLIIDWKWKWLKMSYFKMYNNFVFII